MDAYERVLGDAMAGDATLFAREDYVEEAWRAEGQSSIQGGGLKDQEDFRVADQAA
jgi:glucose-6-phosphate 1-dehydrogenase